MSRTWRTTGQIGGSRLPVGVVDLGLGVCVDLLVGLNSGGVFFLREGGERAAGRAL